MSKSRYRKIVQGFGLYHFVLSLPLAIPIISGLVLGLLEQLHFALSLPGFWPQYDATSMLFLNLFAALASMWGIYRFRHPSILVGRYEGWTMVAFVAIVIWNVVSGASALWLIIALVDGIGAVLHIRGRWQIESEIGDQ